jgi:hypothetical protein
MKIVRIELNEEEYQTLLKFVDGFDANDLAEMQIDVGDYDLLWSAITDDANIEEVE